MEMYEQIRADIAYRRNVSDMNESIKMPKSQREWIIFSQAADVDYSFVVRHHHQMSLEYLLMNEKIKCRKEIAEYFKDEIDWTKTAMFAMFRLKNTKEPDSTIERKEILDILKANSDRIMWSNISYKRYLSSINNDFVDVFYQFLDWESIIGIYGHEIKQEIIQKAINYGIISWEAVAAISLAYGRTNIAVNSMPRKTKQE